MAVEFFGKSCDFILEKDFSPSYRQSVKKNRLHNAASIVRLN